MRAAVGKYKFGRHYSKWGIWEYTTVNENGALATFVKDVNTFEDALRETFALNGWGQPQIRRQF